MKAYALGRRSKWKDYVDLFFIMKNYYSISEVIQEAKSVFKDLFSEKLFRAQLCFFDDMDYSEEVDFTIENPPSNEEIQDFLREIAIDI
jgi:hypothetical protein